MGSCFQVEGREWHLAPEALSHIYKSLGADGRFFGFGAFLAAPEKMLCPD